MGTSLAKLKENEKITDASAATEKNGRATGLPSSTVNRTLDFDSIESVNRNATAVGGSWNDMQYGHHLWGTVQLGSKMFDNKNVHENNQQLKQQKPSSAVGEVVNDKQPFNHKDSSTSFESSAWKSIRRLSPSSPERHWGTAILLLFLWWGPALSLLIIPPRKEPSSGYATVSQDHEDDKNDELDADGDELVYDEIEVTEQDVFLDEVATNRRPLPLTKTEEGRSDSSTSMRRDFTLLEMLRTGRAWLMAWTFLVLVGGGTLMTCNIGEERIRIEIDHDNLQSMLYQMKKRVPPNGS